MNLSAAKKAWRTRRKKNPKKWKKREAGGTTDHLCYIVQNGKVHAVKESTIPKGKKQTIFYSSFEAEQVAKNGPQWFLRKRR